MCSWLVYLIHLETCTDILYTNHEQINTSRNKRGRATDLQLADHAADEESVERQEGGEYGQRCEGGRTDGLPEQHDTHRHQERHVPRRVNEHDEVVQLLRVHGHQVGDGADRGTGAGRGRQTQGLYRRGDRMSCQYSRRIECTNTGKRFVFFLRTHIFGLFVLSYSYYK